MSVDLRSNSQFARVSVLLMDDCIIKLEHTRTQDRIRKIMYENIESVTFSRRIPGWHIGICTLFLLVPGVVLLFMNEITTTVIGGILSVVGGLLITMYFVFGRTTVRVAKGGKGYDITGMFRPGKVRKFRAKLVAGIRRVQEQRASTGDVVNTVVAPRVGEVSALNNPITPIIGRDDISGVVQPSDNSSDALGME